MIIYSYLISAIIFFFMLLTNSCTHSTIGFGKKVSETLNGFEFTIYKHGYSLEKNSNKWHESKRFFENLEQKDILFKINSIDIQLYDWESQVITLTKESTFKNYHLLSHPDIITEDDEAFKSLKKQVYEIRGEYYDPDFHIAAYLYGDHNIFTVIQNGKLIYGGVFQDPWSQIGFDLPVARCHIINMRLIISILPHSIPFASIDPTDEMGNFRQIQFNDDGNIFLESFGKAKSAYVTDNLLFNLSVDTFTLPLKKLIRNKDIRLDFKKSGKLKDKSFTGSSELMKAGFNGDLNRVKHALKEKSHINKCDYFGRTALIYSAMNGSEKVTEFLLENGADYKWRDKYNLSALDYAKKNSHQSISKMILIKDEEDNQQINQYIKAVEKGDKDYFLKMINNGLNLNEKNIFGNSPLHIATDADKLDIIKILIENGSDINTINADKKTPLNIAATRGYSEISRYLISKNARLDIDDISGHSALINATLNGHLECVKQLITSNKAVLKETLMVACENGHEAIVQFLITNGIDLNARHTSGETADARSRYNGISSAWSGDRYKWTALMYAAKNGHAEIVDLLLKNGARIDETDNVRNTPLLIAAKNNKLTVVKLLVKNGANINVSNSEGASVLISSLYVAYDTGNYDMADFLVSKNVDLEDAYLLNVSFGRYDIVNYLVLKGVNLDAKDVFSDTALMQLTDCVDHNPTTYKNEEDAKIAELLLSKGADLYIKDSDGATALDRARKYPKCCKKVLEVFERYDKIITKTKSKKGI